MAVTYKKLWHMLLDKNMKKKTSTKVWDITIRNQELKEFIFQLKQMQNNILNGV